MKYYEVALLTGTSPEEIETWSDGDINWTLAVHFSQQEARLQIANRHKVGVSDVPTPVSVVISADE